MGCHPYSQGLQSIQKGKNNLPNDGNLSALPNFTRLGQAPFKKLFAPKKLSAPRRNKLGQNMLELEV
jgi:hypothetical protein